MNTVRLTYWADSDGTGELSGVLEAEGFAGSGSAWFTPAQIRDFCRQLDRYPLAKGEPTKLAGGFWEGGNLKTTNLSISVVPKNALGSLRIDVELADADERRVAAWFSANYEDIGRFQRQLEALVDGKVAEAILTGTRS